MLVVKMAFIGGIRAAVMWWMISVAGIFELTVSEGLGWVGLPDQLESSGYVMDAVVAAIIPTAALLIASAFEWSRGESESALTKALEERARAEQATLMSKADKMASIGLLAAGVGHEINNPLTFIGGNIDFVLASLDENNPEHQGLIEALRDAGDGVSRIARITGDLSTFARPDSGFATESVDLNAVAKTAVRLTRPEVEFERLIPRMLAPHSVVFCNSASQAMMHLKDDSAFDVVLSDVMMHPTPGWEFLEQVRRAHPELEGRFAFMTGGAFTPAARAHVDGSGVPVISKPFTREDLEAALKLDARPAVPLEPEMA